MRNINYKTDNNANKGNLKSFLIFVGIFVLTPILVPIILIVFSLFNALLVASLDYVMPNELREPVSICIPIVLTLFAVILWFIFGRDKHVTQIVTFEPPKDINSAELELNCYGFVSERGVKSLIYYLASKDYLKIEKLNNNCILRKLKQYDGNDEAEKMFFDGIFGDDVEIVNLNKLITLNSFYILCINVQKLINKLNKDNFKNSSTLFSKVIIVLICSLGIGLSLLFTLTDYSFKLLCSPFSLLFLFTFIAILAAVYFCCNFEQMQGSLQVGGVSEQTARSIKKQRKLFTLLFMLVWCAGFGGIPLFILSQYDMITFNHPKEIIVGLVCLIISFICVNNMPQLSRKGRELKGLAIGFKRFLEVTEKRRFDELIEQNPNYAKEIYPYAFALGITESYITNLDVLSASQSYSGDYIDPESLKQIYNILR